MKYEKSDHSIPPPQQPHHVKTPLSSIDTPHYVSFPGNQPAATCNRTNRR
jgi:hypothetical protein